MESMKRSLGTWPDAPLAFVQASVHFPTLLGLPDRMAKAQEILLERFPRVSQEFNFSFPGDTPGAPPQRANAFHYANASNTFGFRINADSVTCQSVDYAGSKAFIENFAEIASQVMSALGVAHLLRTSFQTIDLFMPTARKSAAHVLIPALRPWLPPSNDIGKLHMGQQVFQFNEPSKRLFTVAHLHHEVANILPPNFDPMQLALSKPQVAARELLQAKPDSRFSFLIVNALQILESPIERQAFNVAENMAQLHAAAKRVFLAAVTEDAVNAWSAS